MQIFNGPQLFLFIEDPPLQKESWNNFENKWKESWAKTDAGKEIDRIKSALSLLKKGIEHERANELKFFHSFLKFLESEGDVANTNLITQIEEAIKKPQKRHESLYRDLIRKFNATVIGDDESKRRLQQASVLAEALEKRVNNLQKVVEQVGERGEEVNKTRIYLNNITEVGLYDHQKLIQLLSDEGNSLTNDIEIFSELLIKKIKEKLKILLNDPKLSLETIQEQLKNFLSQIYLEVFEIMKTENKEKIEGIEDIIEQAIQNATMISREKYKKTDLSSIEDSAISIVDFFIFKSKTIKNNNELEDLINFFNETIFAINTQLQSLNKQIEQTKGKEFKLLEEYTPSKKNTVLKTKIHHFLEYVNKIKPKIISFLNRLSKMKKKAEETEKSNIGEAIKNLKKIQERIENGDLQYDSVSEVQIASNDKYFRTSLEETLTALALNSLENVHTRRAGQSNTKDDIRGFAIFSPPPGIEAEKLLSDLIEIEKDFKTDTGPKKTSLIQKEGTKASNFRKYLGEVLKAKYEEQSSLILSNLFEIRVTNKFYTFFDPNFAFKGGSLGAGLEEQIDNIRELYERAGVPFINFNLLTTMIYNAGPYLPGQPYKDPIEKYLSAAVFLMFDDALANFQDWFNKEPETTPSILHLYSLQGYLFPASFILQEIYNVSEKGAKELVFYQDSSPVRIINPLSKSYFYASEHSKEKENDLIKQVSNFFNDKREKVKITNVMAVNFLNIIQSLQEGLTE